MKRRPAAVWEPDNYPSVEAESLGPEEMEARAHWERFLPKLVAELNQQGPLALDTAIRKAWWLTEYHVLLAQYENPSLYELYARETFRNQWLWLPPEPSTTPASPPPTTSSRTPASPPSSAAALSRGPAATSRPFPRRPANVLWQEGDKPEPVTPFNPLVGIEVQVLKVWLENSTRLKKAYHCSPRNKRAIENLVRTRVHEEFLAALHLRARGMTVEQAEEVTKPVMWTPPTWPIRKR